VDNTKAERAPRLRSRQRDLAKALAHGARVAELAALQRFRRERDRKGDRIAVEAKRERHVDLDRGAAAAERGGDSERRDHMRGVGMAVKQAVAHRRPAEIANQFDLESVRRGESSLARQNRQGGVDQRQETDPDAVERHLSSPINAALVMIASATSAMRRLDCIA